MFIFGENALDPARRELRRNRTPVEVEPQVFDLLEYLIRHRDRVVSKDDLVAHVWQGRPISDATISVRINAARKAVGDSGDDQRMIRTLARRGFRFVAAVTEDVRQAGEPSSQRVSFCRTRDGVNIATAETGGGPVLLRTATWLNHLEYEWQSPIRLPLLRFLTERFRLIRYDGRGNGLSDWDVPAISFEGFLTDLEAVVDSLDLREYALIGTSQGAAIAIAHAARHPDRVTKLVLHGSYARGRNRRGAPVEQATAQALVEIMRRGWGEEGSAFMRAYSSLFMPNATAEEVRWLANLQRNATSADVAVRLRAAYDDIDVSDLLGRVRAPTLVFHSRRDAVAPFEEGKRVAASIPGAKFVPLDSDNHIILANEPAWPQFLHQLESFLGEADR